MQLTLAMARSEATGRKTVAWFIAGSDPRTWVEELVRWNAPLQSLRLLAVPRSLHDRRAIGALVTCNESRTAFPDVEAFGSLAIPYSCVGGRLSVPVASEFFPAVSDPEIVGLLPGDESQFVWHPSAGLIRFERSEQLRVVDLIQTPVVKDSCWDRAVPGVSYRSRLLSIEPAEQPSADEVLRAGGDGIGADGASLDELPPTPDEGLKGKFHEWTKPLRNAWKSLTHRPPANPPAQPPVSNSGSKSGSEHAHGRGGGLLGWMGMAAAAGAAMIGKMIPQSIVDQTARLREIDRLMHLLKDDPDAGLRFALPMGGGAAARGIAPASNQLPPRDTNFGLGRLFASQPVDSWDVPPDQQVQLIQMYRELAAREIRLGRHRRAAYIYAELLGDLSSAAGTLESGRHYREAATLYRDKLKRPNEAARCLELGGFLDDAAELYVELGMMEQAADLYVRLERPDEAERLLKNWAAQLAHQGHYVRASEVFHQKLHDVDSALDVLDAGWNQVGATSDACLERLFVLLGESARHDAAATRVAALRDSTEPGSRLQIVARVLSGVARNYIDQTVRDDASDATRVVVARRLPISSPTESSQLLASIRTLAPQDRLLGRDCDRFVKQRENSLRRQSANKQRRTKGLSLVGSFSLESRDRDIKWRAVKANSDALYAIGHTGGGLILRRVPWSNTLINNQNAYWANISPDRRILFDLGRTTPRQVFVHAVGAEPLGLRGLLTESAPLGQSETAGSPSWASASTLAFACGNGVPAAWHLAHKLGTLELTGFNFRGDIVTSGSLGISVAAETINSVSVAICASVTPIRIGAERFLCRPIFSDATDRFVELESQIESLESYRDNQVDCVVALFDVGGVMIREPVQENRPQSLAEGIESPCGTFLQGGRFVVAGRKECRVYRFDEGYPNEFGMVTLDSPAVAVVRTDSIGQFGVVSVDGTVQLFKMT